jgi:hypothetical protein
LEHEEGRREAALSPGLSHRGVRILGPIVITNLHLKMQVSYEVTEKGDKVTRVFLLGFNEPFVLEGWLQDPRHLNQAVIQALGKIFAKAKQCGLEDFILLK